MLFGFWGQLAAQEGWTGAEADMQRAEFTVRVLEIDVTREEIPSWGRLSEEQISALKGALKRALRLLDTEDTPAGVESSADALKRRQLVWGVRKDLTGALGSESAMEATIRSVGEDVYRGRPEFRRLTDAQGGWKKLPLRELRNLRTAARIARQKARENSKTGAFSGVTRPESPF
jgi:hypothetical protein